MITDYANNDQIQKSSTLIAKINQAIAMIPGMPSDDARKNLLTQVVNSITTDQASAAMSVSLLIGSLDKTELDIFADVVDIDRLRAAGDAMLLLMGYVEAISLQTDASVKEHMIAKLAAAVAPDRAHTNAVDNAVVAVESGPLAF